MKIITVTCHKVFNYGATLQAYALQHFLEKNGHEVLIADFRPWYNNNRYNIFYYNRHATDRMTKIMNRFPLFKYLYLPYHYKKEGAPVTLGRKKPFLEFDREFLHLTKKTYYTSHELKKNPPQADLYIAGSDQIWNTECDNGNEPGYYLDFGAESIRRISYAASIATDEIATNSIKFVKEQLSKFNFISVRESSSIEALRKIGINNVSHALDPVFLLDKNEWEEIIPNAELSFYVNGPYILLYDFIGNDKELKDFVIRISQMRNFKIVSINDYSQRDYADININNAGPLEFLFLLKNANIIISSSFHATAFSIIMEKEFYSFPLVGQNNSSRIKDLLSLLLLDKRFKPKEEDNELIDYNKVNETLLKYISRSKETLLRNLTY